MSYVPVAPLRWKDLADGTLEVEDRRGGPSVRFKPHVAPLLAAIADGAPISALAQHVAGEPARADMRARQMLLHMRRLGYVDVPVAVPAAVAARYEVVGELGRGGTGIAWACRDGGADVVVKHAWDFLVPLPTADAALRAEDDVLRRLVHPGIVARRDSFEADMRLYLVRDLVRGEDLGRHERAPLADPADARALLREAAIIVHHAHASGFLLLDLRPGNFVRSDRLVLLDVGLARPHVDGAVQLERPVGVAGFVAPEVIRGGAATTKSDVWSLGAVYAFLRTGRHAPRGDVVALAASLPDEERALVRRLCADAPADRPGAADLLVTSSLA